MDVGGTEIFIIEHSVFAQYFWRENESAGFAAIKGPNVFDSKSRGADVFTDGARVRGWDGFRCH
jgi:hypothetical protein